MSSNRPQWTDQIAAVLRAATAPAHPEELVREGVASAAFVNAAQLATATRIRRPSMLRTTLARILTVRAAIVFAALGSTGVVLAAGATGLPGPWSDTPASPPATSHPAPLSVTSTGRPSDKGKPTGTGAAPSMTGLCQAYDAHVREVPGKALDSTAFSALITAAGGADKVPTYCDRLTTTHPSGTPTDLPTPTGPGNDTRRGGSPTARPSRSHTPASPAQGANSHPGATTPPKGS